jgi:DNA-binding MarR family transcriptional regulator
MQHLKQFITQRRESPSQPNKDQILRQQVVRDTQDEKQFIVGLHKVGYVQSPDYSLSDVLHIPEFQILRIIKDREPINIDQIKEIASKMPPVQVTRMLSRLEADNHIVQTESSQYQLSMDFVSILVTGEPVS